MQRWVENELAGGHFGDARLDVRLGKVLDGFGATPSLSIPAACRGRAEVEATYRFLANPKVTPEKILAPHRAATMVRMEKEKVVLVSPNG